MNYPDRSQTLTEEATPILSIQSHKFNEELIELAYNIENLETMVRKFHNLPNPENKGIATDKSISTYVEDMHCKLDRLTALNEKFKNHIDNLKMII